MKTAVSNVAHTIRSHVSAFQRFKPAPPLKTRLVDGSIALMTPTMEAAHSASIGAAWFVVVVQIVLVCTIYFLGHKESLSGVAWTLPCVVFNAVYLYCWRSDPGIVRRGSQHSIVTASTSPTTEVIVVVPPPDDHDVLDDDEPHHHLPLKGTASGVGSSLRTRQPPPPAPASSSTAAHTKQQGEAIVNEDGVPLRWCDDCELWQPLRTRHCDKCGVCVRKFDHHCFWVGGCVGERNHGKFVCVLLTATWYVFVCWWQVMLCFDFRVKIVSPSTHQVIETRESFPVAVRNFIPVILFFTALFMLLFVVSLLMWHLVLVFTNQTTWESASSSRISYFAHTKHSAPFDMGPLRNLRSVFCIAAHHPPAVWRFAPGRVNHPKQQRLDSDPLTVV
ncbi:membrane-associated protein, putative [Bodo saltans]|uniref:Palmitoyltransferase n=1 Tax=Bodo saltans TaxID=75058 RepID=A0A0S4IZ17_BODSA|nr:membrane-associated protein, putative [Bodo saltans]|eukprot:CUG57965.1 membrane-associated protein, putative [Bodo saltans]